MRNYIQLVKNAPRKAEKIMWESVERISELMDKLDDVVPDMVRDFMLHEYMSMYGAHFDEEMAREEVGKMSHYAADGTKVVGEIITPEDACSIILNDMGREHYWDAYVGANGIAHDLGRTIQDKEKVLDIAREFWYEDDDFDDGKVGKIWWYYTSKIA